MCSSQTSLKVTTSSMWVTVFLILWLTEFIKHWNLAGAFFIFTLKLYHCEYQTWNLTCTFRQWHLKITLQEIHLRYILGLTNLIDTVFKTRNMESMIFGRIVGLSVKHAKHVCLSFLVCQHNWSAGSLMPICEIRTSLSLNGKRQACPGEELQLCCPLLAWCYIRDSHSSRSWFPVALWKNLISTSKMVNQDLSKRLLFNRQRLQWCNKGSPSRFCNHLTCMAWTTKPLHTCPDAGPIKVSTYFFPSLSFLCPYPHEEMNRGPVASPPDCNLAAYQLVHDPLLIDRTRSRPSLPSLASLTQKIQNIAHWWLLLLLFH